MRDLRGHLGEERKTNLVPGGCSCRHSIQDGHGDVTPKINFLLGVAVTIKTAVGMRHEK
jgi:hypothetical protein